MALFLFIFESIGTAELILIGIIALIFLGPRKLPQIARTIGKTMADFRSTTSEFKSTWEREVNFEEEERALRTGELPEKQVSSAVPRSGLINDAISAPEVKEINKGQFDEIVAEKSGNKEEAANENPPEEIDTLSDKRNWL